MKARHTLVSICRGTTVPVDVFRHGYRTVIGVLMVVKIGLYIV